MHATNWVYRQPLLCCFAFANWCNGLGITLRGFRSRSSSGSPRTHAVLIHSSSVVVPLRPLMSMYFTQLRQGADCSTPLWATTHTQSGFHCWLLKWGALSSSSLRALHSDDPGAIYVLIYNTCSRTWQLHLRHLSINYISKWSIVRLLCKRRDIIKGNVYLIDVNVPFFNCLWKWMEISWFWASERKGHCLPHTTVLVWSLRHRILYYPLECENALLSLWKASPDIPIKTRQH